MKNLIKDVKIKNLKKISDERGFLMEMLRNDDDIFIEFGQAYITAVNPGFVKGWHYHKAQIDNFICVKGKVKVVLYDARKGSETYKMVNEIFLSLDEPKLLQIPRFVYHGFEADCGEQSIILNIPTKKYIYKNPDEFRVKFNSKKIPYKWKGTRGG